MRITRTAPTGRARTIMHARPVAALGSDVLPEAARPIHDRCRALADGAAATDAVTAGGTRLETPLRCVAQP